MTSKAPSQLLGPLNIRGLCFSWAYVTLRGPYHCHGLSELVLNCWVHSEHQGRICWVISSFLILKIMALCFHFIYQCFLIWVPPEKGQVREHYSFG